MKFSEARLVISPETVEKLKNLVKRVFRRQNALQIFIAGVFLIVFFYFIFPPDIHGRITRIRKLQPQRSFQPKSGLYEKIQTMHLEIDMGKLSKSEEAQAYAEIERLLPLEFDINKYFEVFNRLKMEEGYVLDYRYHLSSPDGNPVMYARKKDEPRDFSIGGVMTSYRRNSADEYLLHIKTDGSREGFIQLAALHLIGANFYLYWHAFYDDLEFYSRIPASVTYEQDEVAVSFYISTFHQLIARHTLRIKRNFPHQYVSESRRTIIPYLRSVRL